MSNETVAAGVKKVNINKTKYIFIVLNLNFKTIIWLQVQETSAAASQKVGEQYAALSSETAKEIEKREAAKKVLLFLEI